MDFDGADVAALLVPSRRMARSDAGGPGPGCRESSTEPFRSRTGFQVLRAGDCPVHLPAGAGPVAAVFAPGGYEYDNGGGLDQSRVGDHRPPARAPNPGPGLGGLQTALSALFLRDAQLRGDR